MAEGMKVELIPVSGVTPSSSLPEPLTFQCPPLDEFQINYAFSYNDYETIETQHSHKGVPQLATWSIDTLTVDYSASFAGTDDTSSHVTDVLVTLNQSGDPFWFAASTPLPTGGFTGWGESATPEVQMYATLRSVQVTERAGEPDGRYYSLAFSEFRPSIVPVAGRKKPRRAGSKPPTPQVTFTADGTAWSMRTIKLRNSDGSTKDIVVRDHPIRSTGPVTLARIATEVYGNPSYAPVIARQNHITGKIGNDEPLTHLQSFKDKFAKDPNAEIDLTLPNANAARVILDQLARPRVAKSVRQD